MLHAVPAQGFEPRWAASKTAVLPLDDAGGRWGRKTLMSRSVFQLAGAPGKREEGVEPSSSVWKTDALAVELRPRTDGVRMEVPSVPGGRHGYGAVDHRWSRPIPSGSRGNRTLSSRLRTGSSTLELKTRVGPARPALDGRVAPLSLLFLNFRERQQLQSPCRESNPVLRFTKPMLDRLSHGGMAGREGIEPSEAGFGDPLAPQRAA